MSRNDRVIEAPVEEIPDAGQATEFRALSDRFEDRPRPPRTRPTRDPSGDGGAGRIGAVIRLPDFLVDSLASIRNLGALRRLERMVQQASGVAGPPSPLANNIIRATARRSRVALAVALGALAVVLLRRRRLS
ncbi:MAG: hypothetical protein M3O70_18240 [Actinomycetota bacterium]|nr:hypothetical protein [Actinomycetota bacterium]